MTSIEILVRSGDVMARVKDNHAQWGCGRTQAEAIGDLIMSHGDEFQVKYALVSRAAQKTLDLDPGSEYCHGLGWVPKNRRALGPGIMA